MSYSIIYCACLVVLGLAVNQLVLTHVSAQEVTTCVQACKDMSDAIQNNAYTPPTNVGCDKQIIPIGATSCSQLDDCCNEQTHCYETCGAARSTCDHILTTCITNNTSGFTGACLVAARSIVTLYDDKWDTLPCTRYEAGQKLGCTCT